MTDAIDAVVLDQEPVVESNLTTEETCKDVEDMLKLADEAARDEEETAPSSPPVAQPVPVQKVPEIVKEPAEAAVASALSAEPSNLSSTPLNPATGKILEGMESAFELIIYGAHTACVRAGLQNDPEQLGVIAFALSKAKLAIEHLRLVLGKTEK